MADAAGAHGSAPRSARWIGSLRWLLRGSGGLGCAVGLLLTPEVVARTLHGGEPLTAIGVESLLAFRVLSVFAGLALLAAAELLPGLAQQPERLLGPLCGLLPLALLSACVGLKLVLAPEHVAYVSLVAEDGLVEYATSLAYLGAGCVAAIVARGLLRRDEHLLAGLWIGLALALVLAGLEEISWGQRLFQVPTPALLASNVQHEMNLHNLPWTQQFLHGAYIAVGLFGALASALLAGRLPAPWRATARWILPPGSLFAYFLPVALFYLVFDYTPQRWIGPGSLRFGFVSTFDQEPVELLLSLGFLMLALHAWARLQGVQPGSPSAPGRVRVSPR